MSKILAYPWQHSGYSNFDTVSDRVAFCMNRANEAAQCGLHQVERTWKEEMTKHIPALVKRVEDLEAALKTIAYSHSDVGILFDGHDELNEYTHEANAKHMEGALDRINEITLAVLAGESKE